MSGIRKSGLGNMDSSELSGYLYRHGVSHTGIKNIRDYGITGEMFSDFCEEDIKDAFSVFKDRFIVRKLLRELKTPSVSSTKTPAETVSQQPTFQMSTSQHSQPTLPAGPSLSPRSNNPLKRSWASVDVKTEYQNENQSYTDAPSHSRQWQLDNSQHSQQQTDSSSPRIVQMYRNMSSATRSKLQKTNSELMHQTVSSSNEALSPIRHSQHGNFSSHHRSDVESYSEIKSETSPAIDFSTNSYSANDFADNLSHRRHSQSSAVVPSALYISEIPSEEKVQGHEVQGQQMCSPSDRRLSGDSLETVQNEDSRFEEEKHDLLMNLVTSTISQFSPDQLLEKKSVRGRPSEAQRLGTVLIRNAAQSAKIWNSAPLFKDIPHEQKDVFIKYVLTSAPQLSSHTELVWTRLREALQNRRKYLLDKETGKRVSKGRTANMLSFADGIIDLTDNPGFNVSGIKQEQDE